MREAITIVEALLGILIVGLLSLMGSQRASSTITTFEHLGQKVLIEQLMSQGQIYSSAAQTHLMLSLEGETLYWFYPDQGQEFSLDSSDFNQKIRQGSAEEILSLHDAKGSFTQWPLPLIISPTGTIVQAQGATPNPLIELELDASQSWYLHQKTGYLQTYS